MSAFEKLQQVAGLSTQTQINIGLTACVILVFWLVRRILARGIEHRISDLHTRYRWRKGISYFSFLLALAILVRIWFTGFSSMTTMVGLISAGVAIALKDPIVNLVGWLFIVWRQPFSVGDRIQIGDKVSGDVIDQRVFSFTLMEIGNWVAMDQSTGRVIHVPNGRVFTETVANYSRGFKYIWDEMAVMITFESDWRKAKRLLSAIVSDHAEHLSESAAKRLREASKKFMIFYSKLTPIVYTSVEDSGITLTLRYLTEPQKRRDRRQAIWEDVLDAFAAQDDIDFAYPTHRMFLNTREGKRGVSAPPESVTTPSDPSDGYFDSL